MIVPTSELCAALVKLVQDEMERPEHKIVVLAVIVWLSWLGLLRSCQDRSAVRRAVPPLEDQGTRAVLHVSCCAGAADSRKEVASPPESRDQNHAREVRVMTVLVTHTV